MSSSNVLYRVIIISIYITQSLCQDNVKTVGNFTPEDANVRLEDHFIEETLEEYYGNSSEPKSYTTGISTEIVTKIAENSEIVTGIAENTTEIVTTLYTDNISSNSTVIPSATSQTQSTNLKARSNTSKSFINVDIVHDFDSNQLEEKYSDNPPIKLSRILINDTEFMSKFLKKIEQSMEHKTKPLSKVQQPGPVISIIKEVELIKGASFLSSGSSNYGSIYVFVDSKGNSHLHLFSNHVWEAERTLAGHSFCSVSSTEGRLGCTVEHNGKRAVKIYEIINRNLELKVIYERKNSSLLSLDFGKEGMLYFFIMDHNRNKRYSIKYHWTSNKIQTDKETLGIYDLRLIKNNLRSSYLLSGIDEATNRSYVRFLNHSDYLNTPHRNREYKIAFTNIGKYMVISVTSYCLQNTDTCDPKSVAEIYMYDGNTSLIQRIPTEGAMKSDFFKVEKTTYLAILNAYSGLKLYRHYKNAFKSIGSFQGASNHGITGFTHQDGLIALSYSDPESERAVQFYKIEMEKFKREISNNPIEAYKIRIAAEEKRIKKISNLFIQYKQIRKTSKLKFRKSPQIPKIPFYQAATKKILAKNITESLLRVEEMVPILTERISKLREQLTRGINIKEEIKWPEDLNFSSLIFGSLKTINLKARKVDEVMVPRPSELIPLKGSRVIEHKKVFESVIIKNLFVNKFIGSKLFTYVTLNRNHTINKKISFKGVVSPEIVTGGLIDNVNISTSSVLLRSGMQRFTGSLTCKHAIVSHLETNRINNYDLKPFHREENVAGTTYLSGNVRINGDLFVSKSFHAELLLEQNIEEMKNALLKTNLNKIQVVEGKYRIQKAYIKNLMVKYLNNYSLTDSILLNRENMMYKISNALLENVKAQKIEIRNSVNNIMTEHGFLDVMMLNATQKIFGLKDFQHIHLMPKNDAPSRRFHQNDLKLERNLLQLNGNALYLNQLRREGLIQHEKWLAQFRRTKLFLAFLLDSKPSKGSLVNSVPDTYIKLKRVLSHITDYLDQIDKFTGFNVIEDVLPTNFLSDYRNVMQSLANLLLTKEANNAIDQVYSRIADQIKVIKILIHKAKFSIMKKRKGLGSIGQRWVGSRLNGSYSGSIVIGMVAGHYIESSPKFKPIANKRITAEDLKLKGNVLFKNINVKFINDVNVGKMLSRAIPLNLQLDGQKVVFHSDVKVEGDFDVDYLNNKRTADFAFVNRRNIFLKPITFKTIISKSNVEVKGKINSFKLKETAVNIVLDKEESRVPQIVTFKDLEVGQLSCGSVRIGGQLVENIVLSNETTYIKGRKHFSRLKITGLQTKIGELNVNEINGVKLNSLGRQEISGPLILRDKLDLRSIIVKGDAQFLGNINTELGSKNFEKTLADSFSKENMILNGNLILKGSIAVKNFTFSSTLNGLHADTYNDGLLLNGKDQLLTGRNTFEDVYVKNLIVTDGNVGGLNINRILTSAVKLDEDAVFSTDAVFESIRFQSPINVDGLVQGVNLTSEAIWDEDNVIFTAKKVFTNPATLTKDLNVRGTINGMDVNAICRRVVGILKIHGSASFSNDIQAEILSTDGYRVPINEEDEYWMKDETVTIKAPINFSSIHADKVFVTDQINGVSAKKILQQNIPFNCTKPAEGNYIIDEITCNVLDTNLLETIFFNQYSTDIFNKIILQGKEQHFNGPLALNNLQSDYLTVEGFLNDRKVHDFCIRDQECYLYGKKTFNNGLTVGSSEIKHNSFINGIGVGELNLMERGHHAEEIYIEEYLMAPAVNVTGTLNGIKFDLDNILTKPYDQNIKGIFEISFKDRTALVAKEINTKNGLFAGLDFSKLLKDKLSTPSKFEMTPGGEAKYLVKYAQLIKQNAEAVRITLIGQAVTFKGWKIINTLPRDVLKVSSVGSESYEKFGSHSIAVFHVNKVEIWKYSVFTGLYKYSGLSLSSICSNDVKALFFNKDPSVIISSTCNSTVSNVKKMFIDSYPVGEGNLIVWKIYSNQPRFSFELRVEDPLKILVFELYGNQCFLILSKGSTVQKILCDMKGDLFLQQELSTVRAFLGVHNFLTVKSKIRYQLLLIANEKHGSITPHIDIWVHQVNSVDTFILQSRRIKINNLIWFDAIDFDHNLYLVTVAAPFCASQVGELIIYRLIVEHSKVISIEVHDVFEIRNPIQAAFLRFPVDTLALVVLDADGYVSTYEKRGIGRFTKLGRFSVGRNTKMEHWNTARRSFVSISPILNQSPSTCEDNYSRIYEAQFRGLIDN